VDIWRVLPGVWGKESFLTTCVGVVLEPNQRLRVLGCGYATALHRDKNSAKLRSIKYKGDQYIKGFSYQGLTGSTPIQNFIIEYPFSRRKMARDSISKNSLEIVKIEDAVPDVNVGYLQRYPLLADKNEDEIKALDKAVLKKLDWKFLPCITVMLLMK
jgi:hypothetical protein